tara:strand:- start:31612 stop:31947 length:336 start_codon:yes stop_codon:yes gene_type:complete
MSVNEFIKNASKRQTKDAEIKEIDIEDEFCKYAKKNCCHALKLVFLRKKGFPDRSVLCHGGRIFFVEFKKKGKSASHAQIVVRKILESLGFEYYICDKKGQAEAHLDDFLL